jgi:hemolysin activation/secretion protein
MSGESHLICGNPSSDARHQNRIFIVRDALFFRIVAAVIFIFAFLSPAAAQVPGELVPGRQEPRPSAVAPLPPITNAPALPQQLPQQKPPENSEEITLLLNGIKLEGATVIAAEELSRIWQPLIGKEINIPALYEIANRITRLYVDFGYSLSFAFVPEQEIGEDGIVTIRVIEGFVDEIWFTGDFTRQDQVWEEGTSPLPDVLGAFSERIMASKPLHNKDLERFLLLMNDIPGITARAVFSASENTENASRMTVDVKRTPIEAFAKTDNHLSPNVERLSYGGTATINGVLTGADSLSVTAQCGKLCDTYEYFSIAWSSYFGDDGLKATLSASQSTITPSTGILSTVDYVGINSSYTFDLSYPLIRRRDENMMVGGSLSWTDSATESFIGTLTEDHIRSLRLYGTYSITDSKGVSNSWQASVVQGVPWLGATEGDDPLRSRSKGSSLFTNLNLGYSREQPLGPLGTSFGQFSLLARAEAQAALLNPLLSASQCYYGGVDMGRGYNSGSIGGDHCLTALSELRYHWQWSKLAMQAYGYGDAGAVWEKGALAAGVDRVTTAKSAGGGLRMGYNNMQGDVLVAVPLDKEETSNGKGTPRFLFSLSMQY